MKKIQLLMTLAFAAITLNVSAQKWYSDDEKIGIFYYTAEPTVYEVDIVDIMRAQPEKHFLDPKAPRFLLVDSKKKFALGLGGVVRATTAIDFAGIIPTSTNEGFQTAYIETTPSNNPKAKASMSVGQTEIFMKMVGKTKKLGPLEVYVSMNFMGENYTPQLRNAYIEFSGFSAGQRWSLFTDINALPYTIDYAGPQSYGGYHVPQLRYARMFSDERYKFGISAELPSVNGYYDMYDESQVQCCPNFVGYLQRNWEHGHIRATGLYRSMNYYNAITDGTERENGWAIQLSGTSKISDCLQVFFQGVYGRGAASYINDLANIPVDLVPDPSEQDQMQALPMWGSYGGVKYDITSNIFASFTYGYCKLYANNGFKPADMYKQTQYFVTNMFWNVTEDCQIGAEYLRGYKKEQGGNIGTANRMNLMVQYSF